MYYKSYTDRSAYYLRIYFIFYYLFLSFRCCCCLCLSILVCRLILSCICAVFLCVLSRWSFSCFCLRCFCYICFCGICCILRCRCLCCIRIRCRSWSLDRKAVIICDLNLLNQLRLFFDICFLYPAICCIVVEIILLGACQRFFLAVSCILIIFGIQSYYIPDGICLDDL